MNIRRFFRSVVIGVPLVGAVAFAPSARRRRPRLPAIP